MKKIILTLGLVVLTSTAVLHTQTTVVAFGTTGQCTWTLTSDSIFYVHGSGVMADYEQATPSGNPWNNYRKQIKTVIIGDSVTKIGNASFASAMVTYSNLDSVYIGNSVKTIGYWAFGGYNNLTKMDTLIIPNSVNYIYAAAFSGTAVKYVFIPSSVYMFDSSSFWGALLEINVDEDNPNYSSLEGIVYDKNKSILYQFPDKKSGNFIVPDFVSEIADFAFYCSALQSVIIPNSVNQIGVSTFLGSLNLISVELPNSITSISNGMFFNCKLLQNVNIPSSVTKIETNAFAQCFSLESITIPNSVREIGIQAFYLCNNFKTITIPSSVVSIGGLAFCCPFLTSIICENMNPANIVLDYDVFWHVNKTTCKLYVPSASIPLYQVAPQWQDFLNILDVSAGAENITWESSAKIVGYYNIQGQRLLREPQNGIYIILYDNGKTKKMMK